MRIARICNPEAREPFPSFAHHTTTYVGIPHDNPSQLCILNDEEPGFVSIQADGREIFSQRLVDGQADIELSKFTAPVPPPANLTDTLARIINLARRLPGCRHTRLYAFSVVLLSDTPERTVLATYDFHILCSQEFEEACSVHRQICHSPEAIAPDSISDRTAGRCCPDCREVRHSRGHHG